jgi:hypothetical protein
MEQKVLKESIRFNYDTKSIYFQPEKTVISLELSNTSSMQVDQNGIDDDNFSETAEALYLERMKLYEPFPIVTPC